MKASVFSLTISLVTIACSQAGKVGGLHSIPTNHTPNANDVPYIRKLEEEKTQIQTVNTNQEKIITNIDENQSEETEHVKANQSPQNAPNKTKTSGKKSDKMEPQDGGNPRLSPQSNEQEKEQEGGDPTGSKSQTLPQEDFLYEESGDNEDVLLFLCVILLLLFLRKKWIQGHLNRGWSRISGTSSVVSEDFTYGVSSLDGALSSSHGRREGVHNRRNFEMAPLTSTTEDEWGWEASGGDVTDVERGLALSHGAVQEEESLQVALAMSLSTSNVSSHESGGGGGGSSTPMRKKSSTGSITSKNPGQGSIVYNTNPIPSRQDSWDNEDSWNDTPISTTSRDTNPHKKAMNGLKAATQPISSTSDKPKPSDSATIEELLAEQTKNMNLPVVTSLSKSDTNSASSGKLSQKKPLLKRHVAEDEDIFSSMGLSATPKIMSSSQNSIQKARVSSRSSNFSNTSTTNITRNSNVPSTLMGTSENSTFVSKSEWKSSNLLEEDSMNGGSEWGDDSDLDDLLED